MNKLCKLWFEYENVEHEDCASWYIATNVYTYNKVGAFLKSQNGVLKYIQWLLCQ